MLITIPARRNWLVLIIFFLFLVGWSCWMLLSLVAAGGFLVDLFKGTNIWPSALYEILFIVVWVLFWLAVGGLVFVNVLWQLIGKEVIEVDKELFKITVKLLFYQPARSYLAEKVQNLKADAQSTGNYFRFVRANSQAATKVGSLVFDYEGDAVRCGVGLKDAEAKEAAGRILVQLKVKS